MAPGNVLSHHSSYVMRYFKFLHGSRMTCLPLKISLATSPWKARRSIDSSPSSLLIQCNTHTFLRTTLTIQASREHHHFFIWIPILSMTTFWSILLTKPLLPFQPATVKVVLLFWMMCAVESGHVPLL